MKYEEAMKRLEEIVSEIESGRLDIDAISSHLKKAKELIAFCRKRLEDADADISKILEDTD